jgi:hypothetical protein
MSRKRRLTDEDTELLKTVRQMKAAKKGRVYRPEPLLAISARQSDTKRVRTIVGHVGEFGSGPGTAAPVAQDKV